MRQHSTHHWKIWYDDGSEVGGSTVDEWDAHPKHGVQIVKGLGLYHMGLDYYWYERGEIKSCNRMDVDRYLERSIGMQHVKFGRWADNHVWEKALKTSKEFRPAKPCKDCP